MTEREWGLDLRAIRAAWRQARRRRRPGHACPGAGATLLAAALVFSGCVEDRHEPDGPEKAEPPARAEPVAPAAPPPPLTAADSAEATSWIAARRDSVIAALAAATRLRPREVALLRQDRNAEQIAVARSVGVQPAGAAQIERMLREGRLVELGDSTPYWILRGMEHSVPYVTPDTRAMLELLGRRFHERLDSLGLPRYRMRLTSVLRTPETHAALRRTNANASATVSAHEFGTTVDVSHERFAVPAPRPPADVRARSWPLEEEMLEEVGREHSKILQAELGRAILELRDRGVLRVMMEDRQPVYHMTVARRLAAAN